MTQPGIGTTNYTWDSESRITAVDRGGAYPIATMSAYNGLDTRTWKADSTGGTYYKRDGASVTSPVISDSGAKYTPGISDKRNGTTRYLHSGLKSADSRTDPNKNVTGTRDYGAFGNVIIGPGTTGTWPGPFGYAGGFGYQEDPDHGLKLLGHRYYDSTTGRFLSRDPAEDGRNWYTYCGNNPVSRFDAQGLAWIVLCIDQRGIGHAWIMIVWDNGEVWIMENTMVGKYANNQLYKSGVEQGRNQIEAFDGRADYEYWHEFDESKITRKNVRAVFDGVPNEYNMMTNGCTVFARRVFNKLSEGPSFLDLLPIELGNSIARLNRKGKGKRPKRFGKVGSLPLFGGPVYDPPRKNGTIGGGGTRW